MNHEELFVESVKNGIREGIKSQFAQYNSPLVKLMNQCIEDHSAEFRSLLSDSVTGAIGDSDFRDEVKAAIKKKLAQIVVQKFGGELEKQVNALKSDPTTRARITLAIEEIVGKS